MSYQFSSNTAIEQIGNMTHMDTFHIIHLESQSKVGFTLPISYLIYITYANELFSVTSVYFDK